MNKKEMNVAILALVLMTLLSAGFLWKMTDLETTIKEQNILIQQLESEYNK